MDVKPESRRVEVDEQIPKGVRALRTTSPVRRCSWRATIRLIWTVFIPDDGGRYAKVGGPHAEDITMSWPRKGTRLSTWCRACIFSCSRGPLTSFCRR